MPFGGGSLEAITLQKEASLGKKATNLEENINFPSINNKLLNNFNKVKGIITLIQVFPKFYFLLKINSLPTQ